MPKLIRRAVKKGRGAALIAALQLITLMLIGFLSFFGGSRQSVHKAPAETQVTGPAAGSQTVAADAVAADGADVGAQAQLITAKNLTAADKAALRKTAHFGKKLYEPLNTQVFNALTARAAQEHNPDLPNDATLTTDREDYPPYSYVYFTGSG